MNGDIPTFSAALIPENADSVVIGPVKRFEYDRWGYAVAWNEDGADLVLSTDRDLIERSRASVLRDLAQRGKGLVIYDAEDSYMLAHFCVALWPRSERYQRALVAAGADSQTKH